MIVNVPSRCGYTPQNAGLESLYRRYKDRGFVILGVPANDFQQEPGQTQTSSSSANASTTSHFLCVQNWPLLFAPSDRFIPRVCFARSLRRPSNSQRLGPIRRTGDSEADRTIGALGVAASVEQTEKEGTILGDPPPHAPNSGVPVNSRTDG
jgi:hypothetical protein